MSTDENKAVNRRFYNEVLNNKELAKIDELFTSDYVSHATPPGLPPNREGQRMFISAFHAAFPDGKITIEEQIAEGDRVVTRGTFRGTQTGEFQGMPPTGKKVEISAIDIARFKDGKHAEHWGGPDQLSLLIQLGVVPAPGG